MIKDQAQAEQYFSQSLGQPVSIRQAVPLQKSTRQAPWRYDLEFADGTVKAYVLRIDPRQGAFEFNVMKAMEAVPVPTPRVYGLDDDGEFSEQPCFFMEYIEGQSLLKHLLAGDAWADDLYIQSVIDLQSVSLAELGTAVDLLQTDTALDVLDSAYDFLQTLDEPIIERAYYQLKDTAPAFPPVCFSNGDLYADNFRVREQKLVGVIDFANAAISDPLFEFLLTFFCHPELRGRGIVKRFCEARQIDPAILPWYHGLEFFDSWRWVALTGKPFAGYNVDKLRVRLEDWLCE